MVLKLNRRALFSVLGVLLFAGILLLIIRLVPQKSPYFAGGRLSDIPDAPLTNAVFVSANQKSEARFRRPSQEQPHLNPFTFDKFQNESGKVEKVFESADAVILAYYGILQSASNMLGFTGACGSVGYGADPYAYAYSLFTAEKQQNLSLKEFTNSFEGVGYITLLKLLPAFPPQGTPENIRYYMAEIEIIGGVKENETNKGSRFAYTYGLITVQSEQKMGWKIKDIQYIAEDFLCAPEHGWFYLSNAMVQIVYGENLKLIDRIDKTEQKNEMVYVYASGQNKQYRFDFVRLTNGYDILLFENELQNGEWKKVSLLPPEWAYLKLSPAMFG